MKTKRSLSHTQSGFSLIEVALVVVIGGTLLAVFSDSLLNMMRDAKVRTTETRLNEVNEALKRFASYNNRLPCAGSRVLRPEAANAGAPTDASQNFGIEYMTPALVPDCPSGAVRNGTATNGGVRIGMVPTRTLGLPDEYAFDAWGSRFIYAVTETMTNAATYDPTIASVVINGGGGTNAAYTIVSVGPDLEGGFDVNGGVAGGPNVACAATAGIDTENCNDNATFQNGIQSQGNNANYFDDMIRFQSLVEAAQQFEIPVGAVVAFRLNTCPAGWDDLAGSAGRFIMGRGVYNEPGAPPTGAVTGYNGETFTAVTGNVGATGTNTGGWATRQDSAPAGALGEYKNLPPYIVYRYCVKN